MSNQNITVVYKLTAKPGMLGKLSDIYAGIAAAMEANEPGAVEVEVFVSEQDNAVYVRDEFANADALGFHLTETAAAHFPDLLAIATPGPFYFFGDVPTELKQATEQMQLGAEFSTRHAGFSR